MTYTRPINYHPIKGKLTLAIIGRYKEVIADTSSKYKVKVHHLHAAGNKASNNREEKQTR